MVRTPDTVQARGEVSKPATLSVGNFGDVSAWSSRAEDTVHIRVDFADVTLKLLEAVKPAVIFSPLVDRDFDTAELAGRLAELGFTGTYYAVVESLPAPAVVHQEVRSVAPMLTFEVIVLEEMRRLIH